MADQQDSSARARPAPPAAPPFRGPAARSPLPSAGAPMARKAPPPFVGSRPATSQLRPAADTPAEAPVSAAATPPPNDLPSGPSGDVVQTVVNLPWLDTSVGETAPPTDVLPFPPFEHAATDDAAPEESAQALAGIPYFDVDGDQHVAGEQPASRASGKMHRVEFDVATVLERVASRVRSGELVVPNVDPFAGEGAALAAVLAALLRHRS